MRDYLYSSKSQHIEILVSSTRNNTIRRNRFNLMNHRGVRINKTHLEKKQIGEAVIIIGKIDNEKRKGK